MATVTTKTTEVKKWYSIDKIRFVEVDGVVYIERDEAKKMLEQLEETLGDKQQ